MPLRSPRAWGRAHLRRLALIDGDDVLASAKLYRFEAVLDGQPVQVAGIGAVFTTPAARGRGAARELLDRLLEQAVEEGADLALLFSEIGPDYYARLGFEPIATIDRQLRVTESTRYGAPMTMIRGGDDRDLKDIVALGGTRAEPYRFHLNRDRDLVQFAIARKRLLAGLGPPGRSRRAFLHRGGRRVRGRLRRDRRAGKPSGRIEELGDRDPGGARAGAILQALIAREPAEKRPSIRRLAARRIPAAAGRRSIGEKPSAEVMMIKSLSDRGQLTSPLASSDVLLLARRSLLRLRFRFKKSDFRLIADFRLVIRWMARVWL